ncbi:hypothetical protein Leryth_014136 [Lithospermum erythrorhizon]|nr:hypothetical protein Leryth_014136 [Lithospermum erythrorhizon]
MASPTGSFFTTIITRNVCRDIRRQILLCRSLSSASSSEASASVEEQLSMPVNLGEDYGDSNKWDDLKTRIFCLRMPKRSATNVLERWVGEGRKIDISDLRSISKELRQSQRFKHALEISEWMVSHDEFEITDSDFAVRVDLMNKVFGIDAAERYFEALPSDIKTRETYTAILHCYAGSRLVDKAEALYNRMKEAKLDLTAVTYNELMTLYTSLGQLEKVPQVIEEMKSQNVALDLFTYHLWISSFAAALKIDEVQRILQEMSSCASSDASWKRYVELVNIYLASGHLVNSTQASLVESEKSISQREWITYDLLIILYGGLGNKDKLDQVWRSLRMTKQKMIGRNYASIISSYLLLDHLKEVREIIGQWKQSAATDFDVHICNRLKKAFTEIGMSEKAEALEAILSEQRCA